MTIPFYKTYDLNDETYVKYKGLINSSSTFNKFTEMSQFENSNIQAKSRDSKTIVQEMIKKRREERKHEEKWKSLNPNLQSNLLKNSKVTSIDYFTNNEPFLKKSFIDSSQETIGLKRTMDTLNHTETLQLKSNPTHKHIFTSTLSNFPKSSNKMKPKNVFDRLYLSSVRNLRDEHTSSPNAISVRFKQPTKKSPFNVADRLIKYKQEKELILAKKRIESRAQEISYLQNSPRILNNDITQKQKSPYGSLLKRFEELEKEKERKRFVKSEIKIREELLPMKNSPEINPKSHKIKRSLDDLLMWESNRKLKLDLIKHTRNTEEMTNINENKSEVTISLGSMKYLKRLGRDKSRQRIEDILLKYGSESRIRKNKTKKNNFNKDSNVSILNIKQNKNSFIRKCSPYNKFDSFDNTKIRNSKEMMLLKYPNPTYSKPVNSNRFDVQIIRPYSKEDYNKIMK